MFFEMPQLFDAMFSFSAVLRRVCQAVGVHSTPKNHIFIVQKFRNKVYDHIEPGDQVLIPAQVCQEISTQGAERRKHAVIHRHQSHRLGHIPRRTEGIAAVKGKIPEDGQHQRNEIAGPVGKNCQLCQKGERNELNDASAD